MWSQDYAYGGAGLSPSPVTTGQSTTLNTFLTITDLTGANTIAVGCLLVSVSFDESKLDFDEVVSGNFGDAFNWTYLPGDGLLVGVNTIPLVDGDGGDVFVTFTALTTGTTSQLSINLNDNFPCTITGNDTTNDGGFATIVLPVKYKSINVFSEKCAGSLIKWITSSEINNSHFEVEASSDGRNFTNIGKVQGTNRSTGSEYSLLDENKYANGQNIQYRIKQVDFDGSFSYTDAISTRFICEKNISLAISPNPAKDEVRVEFEGADLSEISAKILDGNGAYVRDISLNTGLINKVNIQDLSPGVYTLQTKIGEEVFNQRFIKVE